MFSSNRQYRLQGWVVSAFVHGVALTVALGLMAQVKPVVPQDVFKWDVELVEPQRVHETSEAEIKPIQEPAKPTPPPAVPAHSQPKKITREVPPSEVTQVVQREVHQAVETSQPIEQAVAVQKKTEAVTPVMEQQPSEVQQIEQSIDESVAPVVQQEVASQQAMTETPIQSVEAREVETAPVTQDSAPQTAMAARPTPLVKADYGWLAKSLARRLAEIKRYPSTARLNGWEGKVVLRAVIRADGHLSEVMVHQSSGHEALDNAAMEAIRLICPLHMHQQLGTSEVAIYVPMVYTLGS